MDSNHRPADYESVSRVSATCAVDHETASDQRLLYLTARMTSGRFPVRRGAEAGHIVAISNENEPVCHVTWSSRLQHR